MPFSHCKIKSRIPHYIWLLCFLNFFQFMILLQSRLPRPRHVEKYFGERLSTWLCLMLPHARKRLCSTLLCSGAVTAMGWRGDLIIGVNGETTMLLIWTRRKIVYQWYLRERKKKKRGYMLLRRYPMCFLSATIWGLWCCFVVLVIFDHLVKLVSVSIYVKLLFTFQTVFYYKTSH